MSCIKYQKLMIPYAECELSANMMEQMAEHLNSCPVCAQELDSILSMMDVLKDTEFEQMEPANNMRSRVLAEIAKEKPAKKTAWYSRLSFISAAAAGILFIAFGMTVFYTNQNNNMAQMDQAIQNTVVGSKSAPAIESTIANENHAENTLGESTSGENKLRGGPGGVPQYTKPSSGKPDRTRADTAMPAPVKSAMKDKTQTPAAESAGGGIGVSTDAIDSSVSKSVPDNGMIGQSGLSNRSAMNGMMPGGAPAQRYSMKSDAAEIESEASTMSAPEMPSVKKSGELSIDRSDEIKAKEEKLSAFPNSISVMKELIELYKSAGRAEDEYAMADRLTKTDPDNADYMFMKAQAAERAKMPKTALVCYRSAISKGLSGENLSVAGKRIEALSRK